MKKLTLLKLIVPVVFIAQCVSKPTILPKDNSRIAAIGVYVELENQAESAMMKFAGGNLFNLPQKSTNFYFVRNFNPNKPLSEQNAVFQADWINRGVGYIFNPEPGTYALVGSFTSTKVSSSGSLGGGVGFSSSATMPFPTAHPETLIKLSEVEVKPNVSQFYNMGAYRVIVSKNFNKIDPIQKKYMELITPGSSSWKPSGGLLEIPPSVYVGEAPALGLETQNKLKINLLERVRKDFEETPWFTISP
ncbi:hypothetical protein LFX25_02710 [Leptospira sp. FAT2]|uniref:hypothetical protein n=1 Tax=Leptospira sanjuanensis TaxID=2879643 RepID=UPI001EE9696E|nr:hypothetical protein [Leptospira sanjuanensis]MCG6166761.1 hypothetical protein [Leptospira sanjuanensis]MCG6192154.1 hypothetical protein [Leptospira sanjuanensis]